MAPSTNLSVFVLSLQENIHVYTSLYDFTVITESSAEDDRSVGTVNTGYTRARFLAGTQIFL